MSYTAAIPLADIRAVVRRPRTFHNGDAYFLVAQAWTPEEVELIGLDRDGVGYLMVPVCPALRREKMPPLLVRPFLQN